MRVHTSTRYAAIALLVAGLGCASNKARTADTDQAAAPRDTASDSAGQVQNPPGYRGMERDTTIAPNGQAQPSDSFLQKQGTGAPQDTSGYSGAERVDTSGQANPGTPTDSVGAASGVRDPSIKPSGADSTGADRTKWDSTGTSRAGDTTGYSPSQQPQDTASTR
jgi:hypothetical protein